VAEQAEADVIAGERLYPIRRPLAAASAEMAVAILGLGGAEFRLPILITVFAFYPHCAIRINLLISFVALAMSAPSRLASCTLWNLPVMPLK
jgi:hypothetical protein